MRPVNRLIAELKINAQLHLVLTTDENAAREMDVTITHVSTREPLWEFVAN